MRIVIFADDCRRVENLLVNSKESFQYLILKDTEESDVVSILGSYNNCREINREKAFKDLNENFQRKYVEFIANLNNNNQTFLWWALNLTGKSTLSTDLCERIFYFLLIARLAEDESSDNLLIISNDIYLLRQVKLWARTKDIRIINVTKEKISSKKIIKEFTPASIAYVFLRTLLYRFYSKRYCFFPIDKKTEYVVVKTLLSHQSFTRDGGYLDTYFGKFVEYLKKENIPYMVFATVFRPYLHNLKRVKTQAQDINIMPLEYCPSLSQISRCLVQSLSKYFFPFRLKGNVEIEGLNVEYLVRRTIREDCISTKFFTNLLVYYCTVSLTQRIKIKKVFYPFENRSWEKMILFALRKYSPSTHIVGYQHASITRKHTELHLGKNEIIPLPDKIITIGEITRDILEKEGNFPSDKLKIGCALRQNKTAASAFKPRGNKKVSNILVILSTNREYYVKTLVFLDKVFSKDKFYSIWVRPHPEILFDKTLKDRLRIGFKFQLAEKTRLDTAINWADVVVYSSSTTVALYAVSLGVPVIYLKLDNFLDPDSLFQLEYLKWTVDQPSKLMRTIEYINAIPDDEFKTIQHKAIEFANRYFYPVTDDNLREFLEVCA